VELYNRIEFGTVDTDILITALAVNDVVRLVAELLDNATRFSPPNTVVVADARRIRDYVVIQVEDRGLGMSEEQMESLNRRLAEPPSVDVAAFRLMGLAVVGRLAGRYGIRIELRANMEGGTIAQVILPNNIVVLPNRPIEAPRSGRMPQLDSGSSNGWDALPAGRTATATLPPAAIAPEPWRAELPPAALPPAPQHPLLPEMPSHRTPPGTLPPTVDRPPLPTRLAQQPAGPAPAPDAAPAYRVPAASGGALGSPTVAYPTVQQASPDLQVAVGFVTPDGRKIPPTPRPVSPNPSGWGAALASMPPPPPTPAPAPTPAEERAEAPIYLQMQASWFKGHDGVSPEDWSMPTAGYAPPPSQPGPAPVPDPVPAAAASQTPPPPPAPRREPAPERIERNQRLADSVAGSGSGQNGSRPARAGTDHGGGPTAPRPRAAAEDHWRTAADEGWQRAMAAAEPPDAGTTRSGLPKRVPQAQLVPGGVQTGARNQNRRSPDEVRGLLSAYHRGVQRGRTAGSDEAVAGAPAPKENQ